MNGAGMGMDIAGMDIDEPIAVELSPGGAPLRFEWRGVVYGVISTPEPWVSRREWWRQRARAPRGIGAGILEIEMWRVDAVPLTDGRHRLDGTFDLARMPDGGWRLSRASDDELDQRLFA